MWRTLLTRSFAQAIAGNQIRTQSTFNKYSANKKLSVMRSVAGVYSYLDDPFINQEFVRQSNCIRTTWSVGICSTFGLLLTCLC
jgi:hypothetical protein